MSQTKIFIADDHAVFRDGLKKILEDHDGFEIVGEACDGQDTVTKVQELLPDILLLDISMPVFNGFQVVERVKNLQPTLKVIILTLHNNESYISSFLKAGVNGYIIKTASAREVILALEAVAKGGYYLDPSVSRFLINHYVENTIEDQVEEWDGLTSREVEVLKLIAEGYKNQDIADLLNVSVKTVESHRYNIMEKLDMHDRIDLVKYAIRRGLIQV